jgi:hypothetical protein
MMMMMMRMKGEYLILESLHMMIFLEKYEFEEEVVEIEGKTKEMMWREKVMRLKLEGVKERTKAYYIVIRCDVVVAVVVGEDLNS